MAALWMSLPQLPSFFLSPSDWGSLNCKKDLLMLPTVAVQEWFFIKAGKLSAFGLHAFASAWVICCTVCPSKLDSAALWSGQSTLSNPLELWVFAEDTYTHTHINKLWLKKHMCRSCQKRDEIVWINYKGTSWHKSQITYLHLLQVSLLIT